MKVSLQFILACAHCTTRLFSLSTRLHSHDTPKDEMPDMLSDSDASDEENGDNDEENDEMSVVESVNQLSEVFSQLRSEDSDVEDKGATGINAQARSDTAASALLHNAHTVPSLFAAESSCSSSSSSAATAAPSSLRYMSSAANKPSIVAVPAHNTTADGEVNSPPLKQPRSWNTKKPYTALSPSAQREFLHKSNAGERLNSLISTVLTEDRRPADSSSIAQALQSLVGRTTNTTFHTKGAVKAVVNVQNRSVHRMEAAELAASDLVQEIVNALKLETRRSPLRAQHLTYLTSSFSWQEMNDLLLVPAGLPKLTSYEYYVAKNSVLEYGVGSTAPKKKIIRHNTPGGVTEEAEESDQHSVRFAIDFISFHLHSLAYGTHTVHTSDGRTFEVPTTPLDKSKLEIIVDYKAAVLRANAPPEPAPAPPQAHVPGQPLPEQPEPPVRVVHELCSSHIELIIETLSSGKPVNLCALDNVYVKCLLENAERVDFLIDIITRLDADKRTLLKRLHKDVQEFLSHVYPNHVFEESHCSSHSKRMAFGNLSEEECVLAHNPERAKFCKECAGVERFFAEMQSAINSAELVDGEETRAELLAYYLDVLVPQTMQYLGHVVRKTHELALEQAVMAGLMDIHGVLVRIDYKMKFLPLIFREGQSQFFGKKGFSFGGVSLCRFRTEAEKAALVAEGAKYVSDCIVTTVDVTSDDSTEDSEAAIRYFPLYVDIKLRMFVKYMITYFSRVALVGLSVCKDIAPHIEYAVLITDGAACFNSTEFATAVPSMGALTGIFVRVHIVTEAGCGKSRLDGHFPFANAHCAKVVREGKGMWDINNARDCAVALAHMGGIKNTIPVYLQFPRDAERKTAALKIRAYPTLERHGQRNYIYNEEGEWISTELHLIPMYCETPDLVLLPSDFFDCFPVHERITHRDYTRNTTTRYDPEDELRLAQPRASQIANPIITAHDRESAQARKVARANAKVQQKKDAETLKIASSDKQRETSLLLHCTIPGCAYKVHSNAWYLKHMSLPASEHIVKRNTTDKDDIILLCVESTTTTKFSASLETVMNTDRTDPSDQTLAELPVQYLHDNVTIYNPAETRFKSGWGHKVTAKPHYVNAKTLEFLIFLQQRGAVSGTNTLASDGVEAMRWKGTARGADIFTSTPTDLAMMEPNQRNIREFKVHEHKDASQIKGYLRESLSELQKTHAGLLEKEAEAAARLQDPLRGVIFKLQRQQFPAKLKKLYKNHSQLELTEQECAHHITQLADPTSSPTQLRESLFNLVVLLGRTEADTTLFMAPIAVA